MSSPDSLTTAPILHYLPSAGHDIDEMVLLDNFTMFALQQGIELYPAQEEAILELLSANHVILNTPTGSGKSLVGAAAHFAALAKGQRSYYTAPIKALVSEKFFALSRDFGPDNVGMVTGDASINPDAPIICCTAEILANAALRDGPDAPVDVAVVDEFHFYADRQRGWAWQVPLLELPHVQFLLMSATLGDTSFFERDLTARTNGRPTVTIKSVQRPVPLTFEYRRTTLHASVSELLATDRAPIYLVHFTQREATEAAQSYLSLDPLTKEEKERVKQAIGGFSFDSPIGKDIRRWVLGGVGVHHAGLLPKYRLLVEKLAQEGLLKIICGTDTLGVGVNVPIRTVLFTQLCKYDGQSVRILTNREFAQIAGRAGRRGYDTEGHVWVQAPPHVVENERAEAKAAGSSSKKKVVKKKAPERGYAHWTEDTFTKKVTGEPEPLTSSFDVTHQMVLTLLDRPGDGCAAVRSLVRDNHETARRIRNHTKKSIAIYRSLVGAELLEFLDQPDEWGRRVRVGFDLQNEFALHQPLSLWAVAAAEGIPSTEPDEAFRVLTVIEAVQENPGVIIAAQLDRVKNELMADMKSRGVEYEERMDALMEARPPQPEADVMFEHFNQFRERHPWVGGNSPKPKSIVREMLEEALTVNDYIGHYGLKRSEGVLLRYLSDVYKGLIQNVPAERLTPDLEDIIEWLGVVIRAVDSSLLDEWDSLKNPDPEATPEAPPAPKLADLVLSRAFALMVHNQMWKWVEIMSRKAAGVPFVNGWEDTAGYWEEHDTIQIDADARNKAKLLWDPATGEAEQILSDPDGFDEWRLVSHVDLEASRDAGSPVFGPVEVVRR